MKHEYQRELDQIYADESMKQRFRLAMQTHAIETEKPKQHKPIVSISVCALIIMLVFGWMIDSLVNPSSNNAEVPLAKLILHKDEFQIGGLGSVGYGVQTSIPASTLFSHNVPLSLPDKTVYLSVFENVNRTEMGEVRTPYTKAKGEQVLREYSERLKLQDTEILYDNDGQPYVNSLIGTMWLRDQDGVMFTFHPSYIEDHPIALSADSKEEVQANIENIQKNVPDLIPFQKPWIDIIYMDMTLQQSKQWQIQISETSEDPAQNFINHQMKQMMLYADENGNLASIYFPTYDLRKQVGNYPIKTYEEAKKDLQDQNNIFFQQEGNLDEIVYAEIVYHTAYRATYYMPYYRFIVKAKDQSILMNQKSGSVYVDYYVPAVQNQYFQIIE